MSDTANDSMVRALTIEECAKVAESCRPVSRESAPRHWEAYEKAWGMRETVAVECARKIRAHKGGWQMSSGYAIFAPNGKIIPCTLVCADEQDLPEYTRRRTQDKFSDAFGMPWYTAESHGYKCKKVSIAAAQTSETPAR